MKRFWDNAAVVPQPGGGFGVMLGGRPLRLPGGAPLRLPNLALAEAVAVEWNAAGGGAKDAETSLAEMPLTWLAGTAQDRIAPGALPGAPGQAPLVEGLAQYAATDLLCYRAEEPRLAAAEAAAWQPLLDWAARQLDAPLRVTAGLMPVPQDPGALAALRCAVAELPPLELAALGVLVPALGSLVLGLAVLRGRLAADQAHALSTLDERFQESAWGTDAEALERRERIATEVAVAARLVALSRG